MNGETYQIARIVSAAKKAMYENTELHFTPGPYEKSITFHFLPQKRLFIKQERVALSPDEWFAACKKDGLRDLFVLIRTDSSNPRLLGFINTKPINMTVVYKNGDVHYWTPKWVFDGDHKQWNVDYTEHIWDNPPHGLPTFIDNTNDFRNILTEIKQFADLIGEGYFVTVFEKARNVLDGKEPAADAPGFPELPAANRALFRAAMIADVFGAMGSWNDSPPCVANEKGLDDEYERLSAELLKQIRLATMFAVNQWAQ